jgi:hypothetical protein
MEEENQAHSEMSEEVAPAAPVSPQGETHPAESESVIESTYNHENSSSEVVQRGLEESTMEVTDVPSTIEVSSNMPMEPVAEAEARSGSTEDFTAQNTMTAPVDVETQETNTTHEFPTNSVAIETSVTMEVDSHNAASTATAYDAPCNEFYSTPPPPPLTGESSVTVTSPNPISTAASLDGDWTASFTDPSIARIFVSRLYSRPPTTKPWHSAAHNDKRLVMQKCIVRLIKKKSPSGNGVASPENPLSSVSDEKLSGMADLMERYLYDTAESFEEYFFANTLIHRIKEFTMKYVQEAKEEASKQAVTSRVTAQSSASSSLFGLANAMAQPISSSSGMRSSVPMVKQETAMSENADGVKLAVSTQGCSRVFILKG